ncbi:DUF935 domain-containing protein [Pseudoxanthomonas sp. UTMC 1351]|uniref:DUF935 domain-containing protein n=1 Tax=Pseudoxanthomonas sp. UTMC 1351 TaxID=2695853 RepID=UPI0034CDAEA6
MTETIARPMPGLEIATTGDGRDITRPYTAGMLMPTDRVLQQRGGNDLLIYEQVLSEPQVKACFEQRRNAVTSCEWQVDAASDRRIDQKAAEHLRLQLTRIGWDRVTDRMLYGVLYGYSAAELIWNVQGGLLGWEQIKVRNRRRFRFDAAGALRLITPHKPYDGEPAPAPYFWHLATGADHDDEPYGVGLGHWCYWPALFKRNDIAFWLTFLEKFAAPTAIGKYPNAATEDQKAKLLQALMAIRTDAGVICPEGMAIDLLETARSGTADYKTLHDTMDETIAKAILGQTMTSQDGSSRSQAEVHMDVRQDIVKADADLICESFNLGPATWLTQFNFAGAQPPRVYRVIEEPEDANQMAERDTKVRAMGFKPGLAYIQETYGNHWELDTPASRSGQPTGAGDESTASAFAEPDSITAAKAEAQGRLDTIITSADRYGTRWPRLIGPRVKELQVLLDQSTDLASFRERVIELADSDPTDSFVDALTRAGFASNLFGQLPKDA